MTWHSFSILASILIYWATSFPVPDALLVTAIDLPNSRCAHTLQLSSDHCLPSAKFQACSYLAGVIWQMPSICQVHLPTLAAVSSCSFAVGCQKIHQDYLIKQQLPQGIQQDGLACLRCIPLLPHLGKHQIMPAVCTGQCPVAPCRQEPIAGGWYGLPSNLPLTDCVVLEHVLC